MNAQTHSLGNGARVGDSTVRRQLDMLAAGQMDQATFLRATIARLREDPDENWEVLSLLDQYFRLNKIPDDTFRAVKSGLAEFVLRPRGAAPVHEPAPPQTIQLTPRTPPVAPRAAAPAFVPPAAATPAAVTKPASAEARVLPTLREAPVTPARAAAPAAPVSAAEPERERDRDLIAGDVLRGRYRIESFLGQGGRGMVYSATDAFRLDAQPAGQRVAIKVLQRALAKRPEAVLELRREFQLLQSLTHPNIVRVHEFDRDGSLSFFTMEMLSGVLLTRVAQARRQRPLSRAHALAVIRDIGAAVSFAHSRGVTHGDINPQNIFVTFDGEIRMLDFGAARRTRRDTPYLVEDDGRGSFATIGYASPQVMGGEHADVQDDIFSLACVAYVLFSGLHPFNEVSSLQAQAERMKPKRLATLKDGAWRALRQALQFDRSKRPSSVAEFLSKLDIDQAALHLPNLNDLLESAGTSRTRIPWGAVAVGALILGGATYAYLVREDILPAPGESLHAGDGRIPVAPPDPDDASTTGTPATTPRPTGTAVSRAPSPSPAGSMAMTRAPVTPAPGSAATARTPATAPPASGSAALRAAAAPPPVPHTTTEAPLAGTPGRTPPPAHAAASDLATATPPRANVAPPSGAAPGDGATPAAAATGVAPRIATNARVELGADTVDLTSDDAVARIVVRRKGSLRGEAPFSWWTESGTAKPGTDFEAASAHVDRIPDGAASTTLTIPLVQTLRAQPKSFYVVIDQTDGGAIVSGRTLTMVTLPGAE